MIDGVELPKDIQSAMQDSRWKEAVLEEMKALIENETWDIVELPEKKKKLLGASGYLQWSMDPMGA